LDPDQKFNIASTIVVVSATLIAVYITKEVLLPFLLSFLLAYVFYPVYRWLVNRTHRRNLSSFLTMLLILSIILFPAFGFAGVVLQELSNIINLGGVGYLREGVTTMLDAFISFAEDYLPAVFTSRLEALGDIGRLALARFSPIIQEVLLSFVSSVPLLVTEAMVAAFFTYYFLIDGKGLIERALELMPKREVMARFLMELDAIYSSLFRLLFATAAIIAVMGAAGYFVLGVPYPALLGILTGVFSLMPMLGAFMVFGPIAVYFVVVQDYIRAFAALFYGIVFLTVLPGNVILPKLASRGASIHPLITILAFLAPILVLGISGMILGPAVYGFVLASFRTWIYFREEKLEGEKSAEYSGL